MSFIKDLFEYTDVDQEVELLHTIYGDINKLAYFAKTPDKFADLVKRIHNHIDITFNYLEENQEMSIQEAKLFREDKIRHQN